MARKPAPGTRERILDSAARLFRENGARAVGTQQIIDECGCGKKLLYREFASKDELVVAYLERCQGEWTVTMDEAIRPYADDPARQLVALVRAVARQVAAPDYRGCPFRTTHAQLPDKEHPANQAAARHVTDLRARLRSLAERAGAARPAWPGRPDHAHHRWPVHQRRHPRPDPRDQRGSRAVRGTGPGVDRTRGPVKRHDGVMRIDTSSAETGARQVAALAGHRSPQDAFPRGVSCDRPGSVWPDPQPTSTGTAAAQKSSLRPVDSLTTRTTPRNTSSNGSSGVPARRTGARSAPGRGSWRWPCRPGRRRRSCPSPNWITEMVPSGFTVNSWIVAMP